MDELIIGLIEIIDEQQALITDLIDVRPVTKRTPEIRRALKRIATKMENQKRNAKLILEKSGKLPAPTPTGGSTFSGDKSDN